jgi:hypothetical protein
MRARGARLYVVRLLDLVNALLGFDNRVRRQGNRRSACASDCDIWRQDFEIEPVFMPAFFAGNHHGCVVMFVEVYIESRLLLHWVTPLQKRRKALQEIEPVHSHLIVPKRHAAPCPREDSAAYHARLMDYDSG